MKILEAWCTNSCICGVAWPGQQSRPIGEAGRRGSQHGGGTTGDCAAGRGRGAMGGWPVGGRVCGRLAGWG